jgi:hypothetical protein
MAGLANSSPAGSAGEIQFNNGSGAFGADASFNWDNTNKRLGIGTSNPAAQLEIHPPSGAQPGVNISQTGPTNLNIGTNDFYYNNFTISNDQISTSNPPGGGGPGRLSANNIYTYGFDITMHNGGNDTGSKAALVVTLNKDTNSNPGTQPGPNVIPGYHGATGDHVGAAFGIGASASDGGTDTSITGCNGTLAACNPFLRVNAGATNYFWIGGAEVDIGSAAGSSYRNRFGWNVCAMGDGPQGVDFDCAYAIGGAGTSPWKLGLSFSMFNGGQPIAANGTLIGTYASFSAAFGIDFRQVNLSQFAIISNGFSVTGTGALMSTDSSNVSDRPLKRDIEDGTKYGLDDLLKIKVRDAVLVSEGVKRPSIIAQELYALIPEAVRMNGDDGASELAPDVPAWGVSYATLVPLLIKAVQDLTRKVELLERASDDVEESGSAAQRAVDQLDRVALRP